VIIKENEFGSDYLEELRIKEQLGLQPPEILAEQEDDPSILVGDTIVVDDGRGPGAAPSLQHPPIQGEEEGDSSQSDLRQGPVVGQESPDQQNQGIEDIPSSPLSEVPSSIGNESDYARPPEKPQNASRKRGKSGAQASRSSGRLRGTNPEQKGIGNSDGFDAAIIAAEKARKRGDEDAERFALLVALYSANQDQEPPPQTITEAYNRPDGDKWKQAVREELRSLLKNHTWDLVTRPGNRQLISTKWVFKVKSSGRYKARMVARGFSQEYGIDYFETYAPVSRFASIRMILALAAKFKLHLQQMDVQTTFLYGDLEEDIYMEPPEGLSVEPGQVCKLRKSLYGLKQAPRVWYKVIDKFFISQGLQRSELDPAVYIDRKTPREPGKLPLIVSLYVDDLLIAGHDIERINALKKALNEKFDMTDLGRAENLLGMEIKHLDDGSIFLHQTRYIEEILQRFGMVDCNLSHTPMDNLVLGNGVSFDTKKYQQLTGSLMWPSLGSRPDIAFAAGFLGRFNSNPTTNHHSAQKRLLRYLRKTTNFGILYRSDFQGDILAGYSDSDWGGDATDRKSTSGNSYCLYGGLVSFASTKQKTVALSSLEAEYAAIALAVKEALWLMRWLQQVGIDITSVPINVDNTGAIAFAKNAQFSQRTKHVDIKYHFIQDHVEKGTITVHHVASENNVSDILTKALDRVKFEKLRRELGVTELGTVKELDANSGN
jgi:hypothetical protein